MDLISDIFLRFLYHLLGGLEIAIFARIVLSWIPPERFERIGDFVFLITEPFVSLTRAILSSIAGDDPDGPIDISLTVTYFLIFIIRLFVSLCI